MVGKLRRKRHLSVEEFVYARARTDKTVKVTLPSPTLYANFWSPELSKEAYPTMDEFVEDVAEILREEVEELVRLGTEYIQLDAPHYPLLLGSRDPRVLRGPGVGSGQVALPRRRVGQLRHRRPSWCHVRFSPVPGQPGEPLARLRLLRAVGPQDLRRDSRRAADAGVRRRAFGGLRTAGARTGRQGRRTRAGYYKDPPAERRSKSWKAEYGKPLRYVPLERLAISPQCGFATSVIGNAVSIEDEEHKLRTLVETRRAGVELED